jgi:hypothetical protein
MNDQVRKEIEDLQRTYGFDEDEALAHWHLRHAGTLLLAIGAHTLRSERRKGRKACGSQE